MSVNLTHARTVCTRPSLPPPCRGRPGNEAMYIHGISVKCEWVCVEYSRNEALYAVCGSNDLTFVLYTFGL